MTHLILSTALWVGLVSCVISTRTTQRPDMWVDVYEGRQVTLLKQIRAALHDIETRLEVTDRNKGSFCREVLEGEGSCYKMVHAEVTWSQARNYCRHLAAGADLVSIESEDEQIYLVDVILSTPHPCDRYHTSGRKEASGRWVWRGTGRPFNYTAWGPSEPSGNGDMCVLWQRMRKWTLWDDEDVAVRGCFICELP